MIRSEFVLGSRFNEQLFSKLKSGECMVVTAYETRYGDKRYARARWSGPRAKYRLFGHNIDKKPRPVPKGVFRYRVIVTKKEPGDARKD